MLDGSGALVWQFGGTEILDAVFLHSDRHLFVHYWEGTEIEAGFKVPFAPLDITTGELDMTGPQEGPFDFDDLVDPDFVGGPIDRESRSRLLDNLVTLARRYPDALWIVAAREYLGV